MWLWYIFYKQKYIKVHGGARTRNLKIRSLTRFHCATRTIKYGLIYLLIFLSSFYDVFYVLFMMFFMFFLSSSFYGIFIFSFYDDALSSFLIFLLYNTLLLRFLWLWFWLYIILFFCYWRR